MEVKKRGWRGQECRGALKSQPKHFIVCAKREGGENKVLFVVLLEFNFEINQSF